MANPLVQYSTDQGLGVIELNNPPANSYSYEMMRELDDAILEARFDDQVHVILIRGAGDRFFCAGADINVLHGLSPGYKYSFCLHANETLNRLEQTPKLSIAAIGGHCVGGGLEIALACDLRVAKRGGGKIGLPEVSLGVLPGTGGTQRLARLLPRNQAIEWMTSGENFTFEEACDQGIVNHLWEPEEFWERTFEFARGFCPPNKASMAVGLIKRSVHSGVEMGFHEGLALERELQQRLFESADAREGIAAFVEKRKPRFEGR